MLKKLKKEEKYILYGIPILFIIGSLMHFVYEITGKLNIIGSISPVNESVWEHGKLVLIPLILWYVIYYIMDRNINKNKWFTSMVVSLIISIIISPILYYFYTGAFGIESMIIDIFIFLISILIGQLLGLYVYKHCKGIHASISIIISLLIVIMFIIFTFITPKLPIFYDINTNSYGITKK